MNRLHGTMPLARYEIAANATIHAEELVALNAAGKAVPAADTAGLRVIGIAKSVTAEGVEIEDGIFALANDTTSPVTRAMRGKLCVVKDAATVAAAGTNSIAAGLVVDVYDNEVYADLRLPALAVAVAQQTADAAAAAAANKA